MARRSPVRRPLRNRSFFAAATVLVFVALISLGLLVNSAWSANIGAFGVFVLLLMFAASLVTTLATTEIIPWGQMSLMHLRQPRILGAIGSIMLLSFSSLYGLVPLLSEKGGTDAALGEFSALLRGIRADTQRTAQGMDDIKDAVGIGQPTLVEQRLPGVWGEVGCAQTYQFTLNSRSLTIVSLASLPGVAPFSAEYTRKSAAESISRDGPRVSTLYTEEETNSLFGDHQGIAVDFILTSNGATDHLLWDRKGQQQNKLSLLRCPENTQSSSTPHTDDGAAR